MKSLLMGFILLGGGVILFDVIAGAPRVAYLLVLVCFFSLFFGVHFLAKGLAEYNDG